MNTNLHHFTPTKAVTVDTEATLRIDGLFNMPGSFTLRHADARELHYGEAAGAHFEDLHCEAAAVVRAITAGLKQAPPRPLADENRDLAGIDFPDTITTTRK